MMPLARVMLLKHFGGLYDLIDHTPTNTNTHTVTDTHTNPHAHTDTHRHTLSTDIK